VPLVTLDFGDGTKGSVPVAGGALARVTHRYRTAGRYTVRATAADRARNKATATAKVSAK
jgi:PKD repeat protein